MAPYDMGQTDFDAQIDEIVALAAPDEASADRDLIREMVVTSLKLGRDTPDRGDLKLINSALKEMRYSFLVFQQYRTVPKVTIYGSARTAPHHPNYRLASDFANRMADEHGWMVVTGAGPGIMEAGNLGAGSDASFGVNIRLPFEAEANPYVHEARLINYKYFFTRKLMFVKESDAFALFPGGFGTQDEAFELLTLVQTGKSDLHPIVMIEAEGTGYWTAWRDFVATLSDQGMISEDDRHLFKITSDLEEAVDEIRTFYGNYHSQRYVNGRLVLRLKHEPTDEVVTDLNAEFADIVVSGQIKKVPATEAEVQTGDNVELPRVMFHYDRRHFGRLRQLVDRLNSAAR